MTTTLYRFFDEDGALLYVGVSDMPWDRFKAHRKTKPWWYDAGSIRLEHFDTRAKALKAELEAIRSERPLFNIAGQRTSGPWPIEFELLLRSEPLLKNAIRFVMGLSPWDRRMTPYCHAADAEDSDEVLSRLEDLILRAVGPRRVRRRYGTAGHLDDPTPLGEVVEVAAEHMLTSTPRITSLEALLESEVSAVIAWSSIEPLIPWCPPGCCEGSPSDHRFDAWYALREQVEAS